ncbi:hypothetical protein WBP07_29200 [Novosphingobium sp. BL-8A]|uniref:hypothetical protein n=1 Tax=Novosphingobium sp. BL-8A TaxID=3127639 RepID=UPI003757C2C8
MADLYQKALESERRSLWAECRLKGLAKDTPAHIRIAELDRLLAQHKTKKVGTSDAPGSGAKTP